MDKKLYWEADKEADKETDKRADKEADKQIESREDNFSPYYLNVNTNKAKDAGYMNHHLKNSAKLADHLNEKSKSSGGDKESGEEYQGWLEVENGIYFNHDSRNPKGGIKNYTPTMLPLNRVASSKIERPRAFYASGGKGIRSELFAQTTEAEYERFLSDDDEISNHSIALDNYDYFLRNNDEIRVNLARVVLAKLDLDRDSKKTLEDILNGQEWKNASGEEVFNELKNRLRKRDLELNDKYMPIFQLLNKAEGIDKKYKRFKEERLKAQNNVIEKLKQDRLLLKHFEDNVTISKVEDGLFKLTPLLKDERFKGLPLERALEIIREEGEVALAKEEEKEKEKVLYANIANDILAISNDKRSFIFLDTHTTIEKIESEYEELAWFNGSHKRAITDATSAIEQWAFHSKGYPASLLGAVADEKFFKEKIIGNTQDATKIKEVDKLLASYEENLMKSLDGIVNEAHKKQFIENFKKRVQNNKELYEDIYNPEEDKFNPQREYHLWDSLADHDKSINILRDTLYIELMAYQDTQENGNLKKFNQYFTHRLEGEILSISTNQEIYDLKPTIDEVNDTYNAILMIEKMSRGEISKKEADKIFSSPLFLDSMVLDAKEIDGLKEFSSDLAEHAKILKSKEIFGTPNEEELQKSIQEMHYLNFSKAIIAKLTPDRNEKSKVVRIGQFLNRNLIQHTKLLHSMQECMKTALNPTTNVETIPSLSKGCIEKLREGYDNEAKELSQNVNQQKGWLGVSFLGFLEQVMPNLAKARRDNLHKLIDEMKEKINQDILYVNSSKNENERMARMMNIQNKENRVASFTVSSSHATELGDEIDRESLALSVMQSHKKPHSLIFEKAYPTSEILNNANPTPLNDSDKLEIAKLKKELSLLMERVKSQKNELLEIVDREGRYPEQMAKIKALQGQYVEHLKKIKQDGHLMSESEKMTLLNQSKQLSDSLNREKRLLIDTIEKENRYPDIAQSIAINNQKVKDAISQYRALEKKLDNTSAKKSISRIVHNSKKDRTEIDLQELSSEEILSSIKAINEIKTTIDKQIIDGFTHNISQKEIELLKRDRDKAKRTLELLHKEALLDKKIFANALSESLSREYHIHIDEDTILRNLTHNGLGGDGINHIIQQSKELPTNKRRAIRSLVYDLNVGYKELNASGEHGLAIDSKYSNNISVLLQSVSRSTLFDTLKESNDTYVTIDAMGDKKSNIKSATSELGYFLSYIDTLERKIENEKSEAQREEYRIELSKMIEVGEDIYGDMGVSFSQYRDIAIKQSHRHNDDREVNTQMQQQTTEHYRKSYI